MDTPRHVKAAIVASGNTQRGIATAVGMDETKLSRIVNGRHEATDDERRAIASAIRRTVDELWPTTSHDEQAAA